MSASQTPAKVDSKTIDSSQVPLRVRDLTVAYHRRPVLWDIELEIPPGSLVAVVGPNGAGKSTLLKSILGMIPLAAGQISVFGKTYRQSRDRVGYVPQRESVDWEFPVSVLDVVTMGQYSQIGWLRRITTKHKEKSIQALKDVGIADLAHRQISQLSGGQQQRTFLARALVQQADFYLMDEPFSAVDASTEQAIVKVLHRLRDQGKTAMVVHHDLQTVPAYFDHVVLLNMRIVAAGRTEDVFTDLNLQKTYGGKLTLLDRATELMRRKQDGL